VVEKEHIDRIENIGPAVVTRFIKEERARGITSGNFVGHLSTFFKCKQVEEQIKFNPVIPYVHSQRGNPAEARPYNETELAAISKVVEDSDDTVLKLAFAFGLECGLRIGEVCNIRLSDIDRKSETVYIRLPTKNKRTRTVPFHDKVKKYLEVWLAERNPQCTHDHLLHGNLLGRFNTGTLDGRFKRFFLAASGPTKEFKFHRCRHSWATRLTNYGMELSVLKELGGWVSWNSMQRYVRVLPATVERQYQEANAKIEETQESGEEVVMSLADFAHLGDVPGWKHHIGNGHAQQRQGHLKYLDTDCGIAHDDSIVRWRHEFQWKHIFGVDTDGEQSQLLHDIVVISEPVSIWFLSHLHCNCVLHNRHRNSDVQGRKHYHRNGHRDQRNSDV